MWAAVHRVHFRLNVLKRGLVGYMQLRLVNAVQGEQVHFFVGFFLSMTPSTLDILDRICSRRQSVRWLVHAWRLSIEGPALTRQRMEPRRYAHTAPEGWVSLSHFRIR
jgi:hypothetical protein